MSSTHDCLFSILALWLRIHFQPIFGFRADGSLKLQGLECLVRPWDSNISTERLIKTAERLGTIKYIDDFVLVNALALLSFWRKNFRCANSLFVSVNRSSHSMKLELFEMATDVLDMLDLPVDCLKVELTETVTVGSEAVETIRLLESNGVRVLIDDVGSGFNGLIALKDLGASGIKIDRAFISGIGDSKNDFVLQWLILLSLNLGYSTIIAEGIENSTQLCKVRDLGCQMAQGFFMAKPMDEQHVEEMLASIDSDNPQQLRLVA